MSVRERKVLTGRSNRSDATKESRQLTGPEDGTGELTITSSMKARWNDTLNVSRDFSPRDPFLKPTRPYPPIFPVSRFPTIPLDDIQSRRSRPLTCPQNWIEELQRPHALDRSALTGDLSLEEKQQYSREFIERNRSKLWQYDVSYKAKTPRTLSNELIEDRNFLSIMTRHHRREKALGLSSSDHIQKVLNQDVEITDRRLEDPFMMSMNTTRTERLTRVQSMIEPIIQSNSSQHRRGYAHAPEYGNFSRFNSILKVNQSSIMKR
jgi:hypothetical protein